MKDPGRNNITAAHIKCLAPQKRGKRFFGLNRRDIIKLT